MRALASYTSGSKPPQYLFLARSSGLGSGVGFNEALGVLDSDFSGDQLG